LAQELLALFANAEVPVIEDASRSFVVIVHWIDEDAFHYGVDVEVHDVNTSEASPLGHFECPTCTMTQLVDRTLAEVRPMIEALAEEGSNATLSEPASSPAEPSPVSAEDDSPRTSIETTSDETASDETASDETEPLTPSRKDCGKKLCALGYAGLGVMVIGTISATVGAIYLVRGEELVIGDDPLHGERRDYRPLGHAFLWPGVAGFVAGVALLSVDIGTRRRHAKRAATSVVPWTSLDGAGFEIRGRF